jgi:hypothetical protein
MPDGHVFLDRLVVRTGLVVLVVEIGLKVVRL